MDFSEYKFRSHMVGKIINVPKPLTENQQKTLIDFSNRANGDGKPLTLKQRETLIGLQYREIESRKFSLSEGHKNILSQLAFAETYGRKVEINSSKLTKGIECEKLSRDVLSRVSGMFFTSSTDRKTNKWVTGAIDIEPDNLIIDIKSSWSWESYSKILQDKPNEVYLRQGDCYMDLWNLKDFLLCHVLVDTPNRLVESEIKRHDYAHNILNMEGEVRDENIEDVVQIVTNHIFSRKALEEFCDYSGVVELSWFKDFKEIPEESRVHMICHKYDQTRIKQRNECISLAREFMNTVQPINNYQPSLIAV